MSVTVIPLIAPSLDGLRRMLGDSTYDDSLFVFSDDNIPTREFYPRIVSIQVSSRREIDGSMKELQLIIDRYGYRRLFFIADEDQLFLCRGDPDLKDYLMNEIRSFGTSGLHYMNPILRGTYGHTDQTLTTDELNQRMRILEGPLWSDIEEFKASL